RPMALRLSSSASRSRITRWPRLWSLHRLGSSNSLFSSARRRVAVSTSKMPPQQPQRLLDFVDQALDFGAHDWLNAAKAAFDSGEGDLTLRARRRNLGSGFQYSPPVPERTARSASGLTRKKPGGPRPDPCSCCC